MFFKKTISKTRNNIFEHGSGTMTQNGQEFVESAGKSVMFAHGHFCVFPQSQQMVYPQLISETKSELLQNNWANLAQNTHESVNILPDFTCIARSHCIPQAKFPPYILCSLLSNQNAQDHSTIFLKESKNMKVAKTPSQLLRRLVAKYVFDSEDEKLWNWKMILNKYTNGEDLSEFQEHLTLLKEFDKEFEAKMQTMRFN